MLTLNQLQKKYRERRKVRPPMPSASSLAGPEFHDLVVSRMDCHDNPEGDIPERITLIRPSRKDPGKDQLFLDKIPVPRSAWHYDTHDRILRWEGAFGGGQVHIYHQGKGANGMIGPETNAISVSAGSRTQMICDVAENVGAEYVSSGKAIVGFKWDPNSADWQHATWIKKRLLLTYTVKQASPLEPPSFTFEFEDKQTEAIPWDPGLAEFQASLSLGQGSSGMEWDLTFKSTIAPPGEMGINPPQGPDTVYPYWMEAKEDAAVSSINGVLQIDDLAPNGKIVGFQGVRATSNVATGYYSVSPKKAPFALFDGKIHIDGKPVAKNQPSEDGLCYSDLSEEHQARTGLPASGTLHFSYDGLRAKESGTKTRIRKLSSEDAAHHISNHQDLHPGVHSLMAAQSEVLADSNLTIQGLLPLTPFGQNSKGEWIDMVQEEVRGDLTDIMNSFVPEEMWSLLFPNTSRPALSSELSTVANTPVDGEDPAAWYQSLATAVLTQGMANTSDKYTQYMNGPRAAAWLKNQVTNSKVYQKHGELLFQYVWNKKNSTTGEYLADQQNNSQQYQSAIDAQTKSVIANIQQNVYTDSSSPKDLKQNMIKKVEDAGQYAKTNGLYWAFYYYTYNTAPAILTNIAVQIGLNSGSSDGTTLTRLFQQNIAVLTALDPSGFFAKQYNSTVNIFLATNILPSMYGFTGDGADFTLIKEYLQKLAAQNLQSEDQQIANAAAQLQNFLNQQNADEMLKESIDALRNFSETIQDALALPFVAQKFVGWFKAKFPRGAIAGELFGSLLIGGLAAMAVFNIFNGYRNWSKLSAAQKAEIVIDTVQMGIQILAAVVKRGVRIYAIFNVNGMSAGERVAAVSRIIGSGEAEKLNQGLMKIGNRTARWLGGTGTEGELEAEAIPLLNVLEEEGELAAEELSMTAKVFGRNLDEFIATRIGPIFILAGIALSIYFISTGETGISLASDIINIVGGSLMIFSILGGWAVDAGLIAAEGALATVISIAGPLAIVAALVGLGLMLYMMFKKPPDPVEKFLDDYVKPKFYVASQFGAIDYVMAYANTASNNLMMLGFSLSTNGSTIRCDAEGAISMGAGNYLPQCVLKSGTDWQGLSKIGTITMISGNDAPVGVYLSLMSDNTVSFRPAMSADSASDTGNGTPTVRTQTWKSINVDNVKASADGKHLKSCNLAFQPVLPDSKGKYDPSKASGFLAVSNNTLSYDASAGTSLSLVMSGLAPNYMAMRDLSFIEGTSPSSAEAYRPSFGLPPSTPLSYSLTGTLPDFLGFNDKDGLFKPNGKSASKEMNTAYTIGANNALGSDSANFHIDVSKAPAGVTTPPPVSAQLKEKMVH